MATYISTEQNYSNPISPFNFDLMAKVGAIKQQNYDANKLEIQNEVNNLINLDIAKGVDKEHLNQRVNNLITQINEFGSADLSISSNAQTIKSALKTAIDDKVMTAVASTQNLRKLQSEIDYYKTKKQDEYSRENEGFALRGAQAWIQDENVGTAYSGDSYNPYVDVNKTAIEKVKAFKELKGDQTIEVPLRNTDGSYSGATRKRTIKGLSQEEILAYMPNILDQKELQQLTINGWAKYQDPQGLQRAQTEFSSEYKNKISQIDNELSVAIKGENTEGLSKKVKEEYTNRRQALQQQKNLLENQIKGVNTNDTASLGGFLEQNRWMSTFAQIASGRVSEEMGTDEAYFKQENLKLAQIAEQRQQTESVFDIENKKLDILKKQQELGLLPNGQQVEFSLSPTVSDLVEEKDPVAETLKETNNQRQAIISTINPIFENAPQEKKDLFKAERDRMLAKGDVDYATASTNAFQKIFGVTNPEEANNLSELNYKRTQLFTGVTRARDEAVDEVLYSGNTNVIQDLNKIANYYPEVKKFLQDNNLTANNIKTDKVIFKKALDYLAKASDDYSNRPLIQEVQPYGKPREYINVENPYKRGDVLKRQNEILNEKGYSGFTTASNANVLSPALKTLIKNSLPQGDNGFVFDDKDNMTIQKVEGGLEVIQNTEGKKDGSIFGGSARRALIQKDSDLYNNLIGKINLVADKQIRLSAQTPKVYSETLDYLEDTNQKVLIKSAEVLNKKLGGGVLSNSGASPSTYLTVKGTKDVYNAVLSDAIPKEKLNNLVELIDRNGDKKLQVKAEVEDGVWNVSVKTKNTPTIKTIDVVEQGDNTSQILLMVKQYPQITASEAILKYLKNNPEKIDELIQDLQ